jgi:hypothetical protein
LFFCFFEALVPVLLFARRSSLARPSSLGSDPYLYEHCCFLVADCKFKILIFCNA